MSHVPDEYQPGGVNPANAPLSYAQMGYATEEPLRPTSVTVIAILGIIFGAFVLLGSVINVVQLAFSGANPVMNQLTSNRMLLGWSILSLLINTVLGALLLSGGIGSLSLKRSALRALIVYGWLDIVFTIVSAVISALFIVPRVLAGLGTANNPMMGIIMWSSLVFSLVILIWPGLVLYFMSRPHVKAAFERGMRAPASG